MRRTGWVLIGLAAVLIALLAGYYFSQTESASAAQPPLTTMDSQELSGLQAEFDSASSSVRVILLLSPTCPTCLRGASAVGEILQRHSESPVAVFAVWEPILPTDWSPPGASALRRIGDRRVRQFWDPNHMVAAVLKKAETAGKLNPQCCEQEGFLWDLTAVYAPGKRWPEILSQPVLFNGPVVKRAQELDSVITGKP